MCLPSLPCCTGSLLCTIAEELRWRHTLWFPAVLLCNQSTGKYSLCVVINSFSHYGWLLCNNYVEITTENCCGFFVLLCLFIYFCTWYALQWEEQALVSALTKTRPQAGVSLWHGHRHHPAGCWLLCGSLCVFVWQDKHCKGNRDLCYLDAFFFFFFLALLCG